MQHDHADAAAGKARTLPLQPAALDILDSKYRLRGADGKAIDENVEATLSRVATALAEVEQTPELRKRWRERFLWALQHGAIPAGRVLSNAGATEHKPAVSTINCTVSGTIADSMDSILGRLHEAGMTLKFPVGKNIGTTRRQSRSDPK